MRLFSVLLPQGHIMEMTWDVLESSGPGVSDPNCISYAYYSNVDFIKVHIPCIHNSHMDAHESQCLG